MDCYQIHTGDEPLASVIDRIAADAAAVAPGLGRARARELVDLIFRTRVTQTGACGGAEDCHQVAGSMWGNRQPVLGSVRPSCLHESDPYALPNFFAAAAADLLGPSAGERDSLEERLAAAFHAAIAPILFRNPRCGNAAICGGPFTDPLAR